MTTNSKGWWKKEVTYLLAQGRHSRSAVMIIFVTTAIEQITSKLSILKQQKLFFFNLTVPMGQELEAA